MKSIVLSARTRTTALALSAILLVAGCTVDNATAPRVTGPSEFGLSVTLSATPDQLPRDGSSQSTITVTVRDASGNPVAGQRLSLSSSMGALSVGDVVTGSGGQASFGFTAPSSGTVGNFAVIQAVPVGTDGGNAAGRTVSIFLTGTSNRTAPSPDFSFTPTAPEKNAAVRFDASATTDEGAACLNACSYSWSFGDGSTGSGRIISHTFTAAGPYVVSLTVTDAAGSSASTAKSVTVANVVAPTVTLAVAPNPPIAGQIATFTATATPPTGHGIVSYVWTFGDGTSSVTTTTPTTTHTYSKPGTFVTTVTATDDLAQSVSASLGFTIAASGVTASYTASPVSGSALPGDTVQFNAIASTSPGLTIVQWEWDFGDGTVVTETDAITTHVFAASRTYTVRLTVTDSAGGTGTVALPFEVDTP